LSNSRLEKIESYVLAVMEGRERGYRAKALLGLLHNLSGVFGTIVQSRLWLYRHRIIRDTTLGCQVLSVGNLTVGGTGKTPVVEVFARNLHNSGRKVAILSRGYKKKQPALAERIYNKITFKNRRTPPIVVSDGKRVLIDSATGGDEPYMLACNLPGVAVVVGRDRVKSGRYAIQRLGCDTLILDDGFQYMSLKHRLDITLVDATNPFGNGYVLPRGILREPIRNIKRAGFIFITKSRPEGEPELRRRLRELNPRAEICECRHCSRYLVDVYTGEQLGLGVLEGLKVLALSGIAAPQGFENELERLGSALVARKVYADHHRYTQQELIDVINAGLNGGADAIVTTEKDAVRFPRIERPSIPVYYLRVEIEMLSGGEAFDDWINRICFRDTGS
jgi:tetraacyldisaccharide 4'-kinase